MRLLLTEPSGDIGIGAARLPTPEQTEEPERAPRHDRTEPEVVAADRHHHVADIVGAGESLQGQRLSPVAVRVAVEVETGLET